MPRQSLMKGYGKMEQNNILKISEKEFTQLSAYVKEHYGINLGHEKKALVDGRLSHVLAQNGFTSFSEYLDSVFKDTTGDSVVMLLNKLTTNHTFFMRESKHFEYLKNKVLPTMEGCIKDKDLRIWSAGCSTGEEPYTIAMIIDEYFGRDKKDWNTRVLATDISTKVLEIAKQAEYSSDQIESMPKTWRLSYFKSNENGNYIISDKIRNEVVYRRFNLMDEIFPFKKKFHVIFCRNVMIYFDKETRQELVRKFFKFTEPGGYLLIGHSESLNQITTEYKYVMPAVYRKG